MDSITWCPGETRNGQNASKVDDAWLTHHWWNQHVADEEKNLRAHAETN